jgi:uncharacterized protein (TIGR02246 family)
MSHEVLQEDDSQTPDEDQVRGLYQQMLESWNTRNPDALAALYEQNRNIVGFDGSQHNGQADIASVMAHIFADHPTAAYIGKVREIRLLTPDVALLRAVAGMVPPGASELNPAVNAVQSLIAVKSAATWRIALFHTTPAQFHGRPEVVQQLTEELGQLLR